METDEQGNRPVAQPPSDRTGRSYRPAVSAKRGISSGGTSANATGTRGVHGANAAGSGTTGQTTGRGAPGQLGAAGKRFSSCLATTGKRMEGTHTAAL